MPAYSVTVNGYDRAISIESLEFNEINYIPLAPCNAMTHRGSVKSNSLDARGKLARFYSLVYLSGAATCRLSSVLPIIDTRLRPEASFLLVRMYM